MMHRCAHTHVHKCSGVHGQASNEFGMAWHDSTWLLCTMGHYHWAEERLFTYAQPRWRSVVVWPGLALQRTASSRSDRSVAGSSQPALLHASTYCSSQSANKGMLSSLSDCTAIVADELCHEGLKGTGQWCNSQPDGDCLQHAAGNREPEEGGTSCQLRHLFGQ
jgi:hypothetical protein